MKETKVYDLPDVLKEQLEQVENILKEKSCQRIAVFDMDNTLLIDDIGDALFAYLKREEQETPVTIDGSRIPFTWHEYEESIRTEGKRVAYRKVVSAMANVTVKKIIETSRLVMNLEESSIPLEGIEVPVPRVNPTMITFLEWLRERDFLIYIISATNSITVQVTAEEYFGIPASRIFGVIPVTREDPVHGTVLTAEVAEPVTVGQGKVDAYRQLIGEEPPVFSAGDSDSDLEMLDLTRTDGLTILVTKTIEKFRALKDRLKPGLNIIHLERPGA